MAGRRSPAPPGALRGSNNVKALFHLAGLQGEPGYGYQPVRDYPNCLRRALREVERYNDSIATVVPLWRPALGYASGNGLLSAIAHGRIAALAAARELDGAGA